jgi:Tripartite tricarboxylate transporter family receptor
MKSKVVLSAVSGLKKWQRNTLLMAIAPLLIFAPALALAQADYPSKPIKIIVGFPPGQATDVIARLLAEELSATFGQAVLIDNKPGQGGSIGAAAAAKSPADGYTMLLSATAPLATNPNLYKDLPYEPVRDFAPITLLANLPFVLVARPDFPASNVRVHHDPGARFMPEAREQLLRGPKQHFSSEPIHRLSAITLVNLDQVNREELLPRQDNGLAASLYRLPPQACANGLAPNTGAGQYRVVVAGSLKHEGQVLQAPESLFLSSDEGH